MQGYRPSNVINYGQPIKPIETVSLKPSNQITLQANSHASPRSSVVFSNQNTVNPFIQNSQPIIRPVLPVARRSQIIYEAQQIPPPPATSIFKQSQIISQIQYPPIIMRKQLLKTLPFTVEVIPGIS